jgi:hypothetical protein
MDQHLIAGSLPWSTIITSPGKMPGFIIWHRHPWGGRFQKAVTGERQVTGGNARNPSGPEGWTSSGWKVFGPVISVGSGQIARPQGLPGFVSQGIPVFGLHATGISGTLSHLHPSTKKYFNVLYFILDNIFKVCLT